MDKVQNHEFQNLFSSEHFLRDLFICAFYFWFILRHLWRLSFGWKAE